MKTLTGRQVTTLMIIALTGSGFIATQAAAAGTMSVFAVAAAVLIALPFFAVFAILSRSYGLDMYGLYELAFGRVAGRVLSAAYVLFTGGTSILVIFEAAAYLHAVALPRTSVYIIAGAAMLVVAYMSRKGMETMGYVGRSAFAVCLVVVGIVMAMSLTKADFVNMDLTEVPDRATFVRAALFTTALPFLDGGLFLSMTARMPSDQRDGKCFYKGLLIAGAIMLLVAASTLLILGSPMQERLRYPFFAAMSLGVIGDFISHIEVLVSAVALIFVALRCSVAVRVATDGAQRLIPVKKSFDMSLILVVVFTAAGIFVFRNYNDVEEFTVWWCAAAAAFYALLPALMLIVLKLKRSAAKGS